LEDDTASSTSKEGQGFAVIADLLILTGSFFILAAAIGVVRFPDLYTRLHASTKLVTLGGLGVFAGTALAMNEPEVTSRMLLITAFFFLTAPLSAYMIARAAYLRGLSLFKEEASADEWGELGAETTPEGLEDASSSAPAVKSVDR
jgi:multicomponent Na+:H+ antiporter subunit G